MISIHDGLPFLEHPCGVRVPLYKKGSSLTVRGSIRHASSTRVVRAIKLMPPDALMKCGHGWTERWTTCESYHAKDLRECRDYAMVKRLFV